MAKQPLPEYREAWELMLRDDDQGAIRSLEKMRSSRPNDPILFLTLAFLYGCTGQKDLGSEALATARRLDPTCEKNNPLFGIEESNEPAAPRKSLEEMARERFGNSYTETDKQRIIEDLLTAEDQPH